MFSGYPKFLVLAFLLATISQTLAQKPKPGSPSPKPDTKGGKLTGTKATPAECPKGQTVLCITNISAQIGPKTHTEAKPLQGGGTTCNGGFQKSCCDKSILKEVLKKTPPGTTYAKAKCSIAGKPATTTPDPKKNPNGKGNKKP